MHIMSVALTNPPISPPTLACVVKVRGMQLDDMSEGVSEVMIGIGNDLSNDLYFGLIGRVKVSKTMALL